MRFSPVSTSGKDCYSWQLVSRHGAEDAKWFEGAYAPLKTTWTCTMTAAAGNLTEDPILIVHFFQCTPYQPCPRGDGDLPPIFRPDRTFSSQVTTAFSPGHRVEHAHGAVTAISTRRGFAHSPAVV